ncbi:molybdate transport repressor ModE-like protein [Roseibium hamelinense]|uniref:Molybdate transport repressor ModE-like protein n=1 Tax=Roseibium hamelinense TaxID=150831 RepID=A0A562SNX8_9HYPH|nr:LysR family transcriptional regulator [Roseibium hamelinense]MTI44306.1 LysR family transcriptional regulator [Roseibium hamelinense]TWI82918.1 molybdate transport repressor ModE-like protein [Roseibium hamelinense]
MAQRENGKLSLSQVRALEAVARHGSFSAAAKQLGVSQPSVSNQIQAIETRFKTRLLSKSGHTVAPTPALERLLPRIRSVLALCGDIERDLTEKKALAGGELRIGYSTYQLAIPRISNFMTNYPDVAIEARAMATQDLMNLLDDGELDIGFITAREIPGHLAGLELVKTRIVLAAPPEHPLASQGPLSWKQVEGIPLIQRESSSGTRKIFDAAATIAGVKPRTVLALGSWGSIASLIRSGVGLGVAMEAEITDRDGFVAIGVDDPVLTATHYVVCPRDMTKVSTVDAFFSSLDLSG